MATTVSGSSPFLIHLTVKILSASVKKDFSTRDDYAVLWLTNAEWDKYKTSKNLKKSQPIQLFLHKPADLQIELFDSNTIGSGSDDLLGVSFLKLFENGVYSHDIQSLASQKRTLPVTKDFKDVGHIEIDFLLHVVYQSPSSPANPIPITYPFKNLVLEGGGVRGIAYGGTLEELEKRNILPNIERVAGTSAGSIAGLCLALGANADRIKQALQEIDFASFADKPALGALHQGTVLAQAIKDLISALLNEKGVTKEKLNISNLEEASFKHLKQLHDDPAYKGAFKLYYAIGTKVDFGDLVKDEKLNILDMEVFNYENTPDMQLWLATRISMSVPGYFESLEYNGSHYVDGGVLYNYAINIFDPKPGVANEETLGLRVDTPPEISKFLDANPEATNATAKFMKQYEDFSITEIPSIIINHITDKLSIYKTTKSDDGRSVYINTGSIGTTDFGIQSNQKDGLITYGREWCLSFFSWWDDAYRKNPKPTGPLEVAGKVTTRK